MYYVYVLRLQRISYVYVEIFMVVRRLGNVIRFCIKIL